jgi:hypothetical protein
MAGHLPRRRYLAMISRKDIPAAAMTEIAEQIGFYLSGQEIGSQTSRWVASQGASASPTLGPGMEIWVLGTNTTHALHGSNAASLARHRVMELAENSRTWHHQILCDDAAAVGFAEVALLHGSRGREAWRVHAMGLLPTSARAFEKGLARIEEQTKPHSPEAKLRMLRIPGVNIGAFWFEAQDADRILVYRKPPVKSTLRLSKLYEWPDFVKLLAGCGKRSRFGADMV